MLLIDKSSTQVSVAYLKFSGKFMGSAGVCVRYCSSSTSLPLARIYKSSGSKTDGRVYHTT